MADITFNTPVGDIKRELLICYLNTGTAAAPVWSAIGKKVSDSAVSYDWGKETSQDILGNTWTTLKTPTKTQDFDPVHLDSGDAAVVKIWNLAVKDEDIAALAAQDMLIAHFYAGSASAAWAERYTGCAIEVSQVGGEGGGILESGFSVTYGGTRTLGTVAKGTDGTVTFTPDSSN